MRKCNLHLQYYKIDLSYSIKLQEINLNICQEYKTELDLARNPNKTECEARRSKRTESHALGALKFASEVRDENVPIRSGTIFNFTSTLRNKLFA